MKTICLFLWNHGIRRKHYKDKNLNILIKLHNKIVADENF